MKRNKPCAHLRPDYDRLEKAHYIQLDHETGEISWEPHTLEDDLIRLGLLSPVTPRVIREADDPDT